MNHPLDNTHPQVHIVRMDKTTEHERYLIALDEATNDANLLGRDIGIERMVQYGRVEFVTHILPPPSKRFGHELRCEVVSPARAQATLAERAASA